MKEYAITSSQSFSEISDNNMRGNIETVFKKLGYLRVRGYRVFQ